METPPANQDVGLNEPAAGEDFTSVRRGRRQRNPSKRKQEADGTLDGDEETTAPRRKKAKPLVSTSNSFAPIAADQNEEGEDGEEEDEAYSTGSGSDSDESGSDPDIQIVENDEIADLLPRKTVPERNGKAAPRRSQSDSVKEKRRRKKHAGNTTAEPLTPSTTAQPNATTHTAHQKRRQQCRYRFSESKGKAEACSADLSFLRKVSAEQGRKRGRRRGCALALSPRKSPYFNGDKKDE
ncbi:hypothetical protein SCHPADRAFT_263125 [Schizopora paradoxa]|uniref:Uncharacterized protein n=1 Tax=Schizopora paradoxa TaxID=27342 RepID=A0A0H2S153_9AGAM|nr:hypothetical protein SCHPADRAFT_263125 [Schizopora paradoxa]